MRLHAASHSLKTRGVCHSHCKSIENSSTYSDFMINSTALGLYPTRGQKYTFYNHLISVHCMIILNYFQFNITKVTDFELPPSCYWTKMWVTDLPNFLPSPHCYFMRLNPKRINPFYFCLPALLGIHRKPMQKYFLKSSEGFLRAVLTGPGMALLNPRM